MGVPRPGLLVGASLMVLFAILFLTFEAHWFPVLLLLLGLVGVGLAFAPESPADAARAPVPARAAAAPAPQDAGLRERLHELDQMLADRVLNADEHRRKRQQLLDGWGRPPGAG